jgi:hypothetical protein
LGKWAVRLISLAGIALVILSITGWWLTTRVLSEDGFADVVAKTVQREPVREYIADQATLRLASTSDVLTAARPVVAKALAEALNDPAVISAVRTFAAQAHHQVFSVNDTLRSDASANAAAISIRSTLNSINPALSAKLPDSVLNVTVSLAQNHEVDLAAQVAPWVSALYLPVGALGLALLLYALMNATEPIRGVRFIGLTMAIAGVLPIGLGAASPLFGLLGRNVDPGRGAAVASFVDVLLGRLVGAGWVVVVVGLLIAYTPGRDCADPRERLARTAIRVRRWVMAKRWHQLVVCLFAIWAAVSLLTQPGTLFHWVALIVAGVAIFSALIIIFTTLGIFVPGIEVRPIRRRHIGTVITAMALCGGLTTAATAVVIIVTNQPHKADPRADGCNGSIELCMQPLNQVVWAASHNSMSSTGYGFYSAEHILTIPEQLNQGARALLIDAYYGYKEGGLVRTNLAGGTSRADIEAQYGKSAADELNRLGALTGTADTSGKKQDVYLCHDYCELGAIKAADTFSQVNDFLNRNLTDVVMLDVEDYVRPADLEAALKAGHLWDRIYTPDLTKPLPTLLDMVTPDGDADQAQRRVIITSENNAGKAPWLIGSYELMQETPYTFTSISQFNCQPNRGVSTNPLLLINNWLRTGGQPDPTAAATVNSQATLTARFKQCIADRGVLPNVIAVDFFGIGDIVKTVDQLNAAIATITHTDAFLDEAIAESRANPNLTAKKALTSTSCNDYPRSAAARRPPCWVR